MDFKRSLAIVIGINDYQNGISPLRTATKDATELARILKQQHHYDVQLLLDGDVTREKLLALLLSILPKEVEADDRVLFYFAGHGIALDNEDGLAGYLVPQDAHPANSSTFLPMKVVHDAIAALPCRHLLAILDCCFAGAFRWASTRDLLAYPEVIHQERYERFIKDPAWQAITSAAYDQKALDSLSLKDDRGSIGNHSPFAQALFEGLKGSADIFPPPKEGKPGGDGIITATELFLYVREQVEPASEEKKHRQTPGIWPLIKHDKGEFIFLVPGHELNLPPAPELNPENNPYRGLESFDEQHAHLFFGRQTLVEQLQDFVENHPLTVILGASGTGKSSLVKAGLLPQLRQSNLRGNYSALSRSDEGEESQAEQFVSPWQFLGPIRPGESPLTALARAWVERLPETDERDRIPLIQRLTAEFRQNPQRFAQLISEVLPPNFNSKFLLIIDQFEELIAISEETEREQFLQQLNQALALHRDRLRIALTLRLDFEAQFLDSPLKEHWMESRFVVPPMTQNELRQAIEGPASERVLYFEPSTLIDRLINEVVQMPGALPLLSFTLSELYFKYLEKRRNNRAFSESDYKELGGVAGSLTQRATHEYYQLVESDAAYHDTIRRLMLRMVAVEGGELARRRVPRSELIYADPGENQRVEEVIRRFCAARLLVSGQETGGEPYVEPAHDALVLGWDKLQRWKNQEQETLMLQRLLTPAAKEWAQSQQVGYLWDQNPRLDLLQQVLRSDDNWLNHVETNFIQQSWQRRRNNRLRFLGAVATFVSAVSLLAIAAFIQRNAAIENQIDALASLSESQLLADQQLEAMVNALKAGKQLQQAIAPRHDITLKTISTLQQAVDNTQELNRLPGHGDRVQAVAFSPNGNFLASASLDGTIRLWGADGRLLATLTGHEGGVVDLSFSSDSNRLASASGDGTVKVWNTEQPNISNNLILTIPAHEKGVNSVSFNPQGTQLVTTGSDNAIALWNLDGQLIKRLNGHTDTVTRVRFSPDGRAIASASYDKTVRLWNLEQNNSQVYNGHTDYVTDVRFSPDGQTLASTSMDGTVKLWNSAGTAIASFLAHPNGAIALSFDPEGNTLATASPDATIKLWNLDGTLLQTLRGHGESVTSLSFSADGKTLASASHDRTVRLWQVEENRDRSLTELHHDGAVESISISPNNQLFASGSFDTTVKLWRRTGGGTQARAIATLKGHSKTVKVVRFSPDGEILASGGYDGTVQLWNLAAVGTNALFQPAQTFNAHQDGVLSIAFTPHGKILASGSEDRTIKLLNVVDGREVKTLTGHTDGVTSLSFSPDGKTLASGSYDKTVKLWRADGTLLNTLEAHGLAVVALSFSPDGKILASGSADNTIKLWNSSNGKLLKILAGHNNRVTSLSWSSDGNVLATASADNTIKLWNVKQGTLIKTLLGHESIVKSVIFSPDNQTLITGADDGTIRIWNLNLDNLIEQGCSVLASYLQTNVNVQPSDRTLCQ